MCQTHSKQTKFTEDLGFKNINAQTQLLIAQRLYHRGAQTDQKEEATWNLKEQHRIEKSQCKSQNSSNPLLQTEPSSARNPRGGQSGADELIPGWTSAPCGTGNRWWPGCSSALPPQKWKRFPACTPWSCGRHFCKSCCWNITWNNVTTLITHLQRRDRKRKRFKESCKIHEETEEPALREGCKSLICLT